MNKSNYVEVRPNIWINKNDPLYEQKFKHYSAKGKNVGHLVTDSSPKDIKVSTRKAKEFTANNKNVAAQPQKRSERSKLQQQDTSFSLLEMISGWFQASLLLVSIITGIFTFFYFFLINLQ